MCDDIFEVKINTKDYVSVVFDPLKQQQLPYFNGRSLKKEIDCLFGKFQNLGDDIKEMKFSDFFYLMPGTFLCNEKAIKSGVFYNEDVELIRFEVEGRNVWAVNVLYVVDCLDLEKSSIKYFKSSNDIKSIDRYVFNLELLKTEKTLFKIPQTIRTEIYARSEFIKRTERYGLIGLKPMLLP